MPEKAPISLPLQTLFDMLRAERMTLAPDQLVRVEQVLWSLGKAYQDNIAGLKTVLAPLICQSPGEQETFYGVFDKWLVLHVVPPPPPAPPEEPEVIKKARRSWQRPLILFGLIAGLSLLIWGLWPTPEPQKPSAFFELDSDCISVGQEVSPVNVLADSVLVRYWDFGDGNVDSTSRMPEHRYSQPGAYEVSLTIRREGLDSTFRKQLYVHQLARPSAGIVQSENEDEYSFTADTTAPGWQYEWKVGDTIVSTEPFFTGQMADRERHYVSLAISLREDEQGLCTDRATEVVDLRQELVEIPAFQPLRADDSAMRYHWNSKAYLSWILFTLLMVAGSVLGRRFWRQYKRRPPDTEDFTSIFHPVSGPPIFLPFPSQRHLISGGNRLRELAEALRQREHSERRFLDLSATLSATVRSGGMPDIRYYQQERPIQYLALVETKGSQDQQSRLFQEYLAILKQEQVPVEVWYYQEDPRICFQHDSEQEVPLSRLAQVFGDHRLIIFGEGETLLHPTRKTLLPGLEEELARWPDKAILTPRPVLEWDYKEQILLDQLIVLPADLQGQSDLLGAWDDRDPLSFRELKRSLLQQRSEEEPWLLSDATDVEELRETLGASKFGWLAAAALYPRPVWELTLAMGSLFQDKTERSESFGDQEVDYDDLLVLTRMPWLQDGDLPEELRGQLLDSLTEAEEQQARKKLIHLLESVDLPPNSFAAQERKVQLAVNNALLHPEDEQHQAGLELLLKEGLLDPAVRKRVKQEATTGKTQTRATWGISVLVALICLIIGLWQGSQPPQQAYFGLATQEVDSAAYYLNLSADALLEANKSAFDRAIGGLEYWMVDNKYSLVQQALSAYRDGRKAYMTRDWEEAINRFVQAQELLSEEPSSTQIQDGSQFITLGAEIDSLLEINSTVLWLHSLHAEGLSLYFDGSKDIAWTRRQALTPAFFFEFGIPNLQTLLGESPKNTNTSLDFADSLLTLVQEALVLEISVDDRIKAYTQLHQVYKLMIDPALQAREPERYNDLHSRKELLMAGLLNGLYFSGTVKDQIDNPLVGVQVGYFSENTTTDSYGQFRMEVQPEDIWDESIAFLLLRDGFQRKDTTIRIVDLLPMQPFQLQMTELTQQTTAQIIAVDIPEVYANLDEALKLSDCDLLDSLLEVLTTENAGKLDFYRKKREEVCGGTSVEFIAPEMVSVPGGNFMMGSEDNEDDEKPVHPVTVSSFSMSRYEITNEQYAAFLTAKGNQEEGGRTWYNERSEGYNGYAAAAIKQSGGTWVVEPGRERHPVNYVSWYGARAYCAWLSEQTRQRYRLPSEAEWEYAAGGGMKGRDSLGYRLHEYAGSGNVDEVAWYNETTNSEGTREVGTKRANELGLYDMSGNVSEWCSDWYTKDYYETLQSGNLVRNPLGPSSGNSRVLRGGSWASVNYVCRVSSRYYYYPYSGFLNFGFRVVRN